MTDHAATDHVAADDQVTTDQTTDHHTIRSTEMSLLNEDLARAHQRALLVQSAEHRLGRELALGRKLARRAERNALRARLHLARLV
jgi:hypothetical protein